MTPIDIQISRSKVSVEGQAYSLYVGEGRALVFYKHLYYTLFQLQTGNMVWYTLSGFYIPRAGDHITFLELK